jgi:hypothetical protein
VIGKLGLHIPRGGTMIQKIRSPFVMALIAGALGAVLVPSLFTNKAKGKKPMNNKSIREQFTSIKQNVQRYLPTTKNPEPHKSSNQGEVWEGLFFVLGLVALSSLILGIISFSRPATRIKQDDLSYQHLAVYSYSAPSPAGVYDGDTIKSGDPIFTKLTCSVDVNFQYTLIAPQAENISGTYQLTAIISEPVSGWHRMMPLQEETVFTGTAFGSTARLDGQISGRTLESTFDPPLTFRDEHTQFYLVRNEDIDNPLALAETGILSEKRQETNTILLLGREIAIPALRLIALFGLIGSLMGLTLLGIRLQRLSQHDQEKFFHIKYSSMMIDVQNADSLPLSSTIDVASMDALAKLAERFNAMILHIEQGVLHTYYVQAGGIIYRFTMKPHKTGSTCFEGEAIGQEGVT